MAACTGTVEQETLKLMFSYLVNCINTDGLLPAALSRQLITERQRLECFSEPDPNKKAEKFLSHLQRAVNGDSENFHIFVQLLNESGQGSIASRLKTQEEFTRSTLAATASNSEVDHVVVDIPDELVEELVDLRIAYAELLRSYEKELRKSPEAQKNFVEFLPRLLLRSGFSSDQTFQLHFNKLIEEEVSLFNIYYLKRLCSKFPEDVCAVTRKLVDQYEQQLQNFMAGTTVNQFKKLFPASATPYKLSAEKVPVRFNLSHVWGDNTLHDLNDLIINLGVPIYLFDIKHAYSCSGVQQVFVEEELMPEHHPKPAAGSSEINGHVDASDAMDSPGFNVSMNITNIGIHGYPGTGKTSFLDLATGKKPALTRESTGCVDPPSRYLAIKGENPAEVKWENVTTDKMSKMLCSAIREVFNEQFKRDLDSIEKDLTTVSLLDSDQTTPMEIGDQATFSEDSSTQAFDSLTYFSELLAQIQSSDELRSRVIFDSHWMMVTDCGGQPPFLDAAALFLRNSCLQFLSLKLNEHLNATTEFSYFIGGRSACFATPSPRLTNQQIIETLAKTVSAIQPPCTPSAKESPKSAKFAIVGTFKDEANEEEVKEKEAALEDVLKPYEPIMVRFQGKVILPVNCITTDEVERKQLTRNIQQLIDHAADVTMKATVKLRWFMFLLNLLKLSEKNEKPVLQLNECFEIGSSFNMDKFETRKAIRFFHDIGIIMHFNTSNLGHLVIVDSKPVFGMVSRLIHISFVDEQFLSEHCNITLPLRAKNLLQRHGRFDQDLLRNCLEFTDLITLQTFLNILEHVKAIAVIEGDKHEYFMPCVLTYALEEQCVPQSPPPWVIKFRVRQGVEDVFIPLPVGYLPVLVVFLITQFPSEFSTDRDEKWRQYRNVINLRYKTKKGRVYFVERHLQLEVYYTYSKRYSKECFAIRNRILEAMNLTEKRLCITENFITKVDCFLCHCGVDSADHSHVGEYFHDLNYAICEKTDERCNEKSQCSLWISTPDELALNNGSNSSQQSAAADSSKQTTTMTSVDKPTTDTVSDASSSKVTAEQNVCCDVAISTAASGDTSSVLDSSQPTDQLFNAKPTASRQKRSASQLGSSKSKKQAIMSEVKVSEKSSTNGSVSKNLIANQSPTFKLDASSRKRPSSQSNSKRKLISSSKRPAIMTDGPLVHVKDMDPSSDHFNAPVDPFTEPPKMSDLLNKVASRALSKWERMGLQLELEQHELDAIQSQDPIKCYSRVFDLWKKRTHPPFTWATVLKALRAPILGENELALEIEKWLREES